MKVVSSVGLLLFDSTGRILILKELEDKPHYRKVAGMLSFPIETVEEGEVADQTFRRLLHEEVGTTFEGEFNFFKEHRIRLNKTYTENMSIYIGVCGIGFEAQPQDTDVQFYGWMFPRRILSLPPKQIRVEVKPVLGLYLGL
jgi:ADP-ribose pyrophosphatase YjhB (NUDIX family)